MKVFGQGHHNPDRLILLDLHVGIECAGAFK